MITFKQHIDLMSYISSGRDLEKYVDSLDTLEKLTFMSYFDEVYPLQDNMIWSDKIDEQRNIYTSVDSLVLGQFIMLEQIITGKTQAADHIVDFEILKLIVRPKEDDVFDNESEEKEKENEEYILNCDVRFVYAILERYMDNRNKTLFQDFAGVFYEPKDEDDESESSAKERTSEMKFSQQWYWYSIVRMLSGEDIHRYEQTYLLPMRIVLPEMSFIAQRNKIEAAKQRQNEAMRKL
jgi:hypothetical protein